MTSAIETVLWPGIKAEVGADAALAGIYADKPGYHNSRNRLLARGMTGDYSIQAAIDKMGPGDEGAAIDITFRTAQAGNYANIGKYSRRLYAAGVAKDPNCYPMREFFGNTNGDQVVDGWSYYRGWRVSSDPSHLWHIHLSIHRKYINDPAAMAAILRIWTGAQDEDDDMAVTPEDLKKIADAVWNRDGIPNWGDNKDTNQNIQSDNALYEIGKQLNDVEARLEQTLTALGQLEEAVALLKAPPA